MNEILRIDGKTILCTFILCKHTRWLLSDEIWAGFDVTGDLQFQFQWLKKWESTVS